VAVATPAETGTIADTRARFGISRSTIYRLAAVGDIRMVKVGRTTLVDFTSVRAFLAQAPAAVLRSPGLLNKATPRG
jgi:excisionase family DNA binding protein